MLTGAMNAYNIQRKRLHLPI